MPEPWAPAPAADFIRMLLQTGFSPQAYRDKYADLAALNWSAEQTLSHFLLRGLIERRVAPMTLDHPALVALSRLAMADTAFKSRLLTSLGAHLFDNADHPYDEVIAKRWPTVQALANQGARPYFIVGDSHTNQYRLTGARDDAWLLPIHILCTGASARGLGNPASRSGYGQRLHRVLRTIEALPGVATIPLLLQFGQVDIEFVHHFQRARDGKKALDLDDYRAFCDATAEQYIQFLAKLLGKHSGLPVYLVSVFPPALADAAWHRGYVNADIVLRETTGSVEEMTGAIRQLQIATLKQRTEMHAYFNDLLRAACRQHGFGFVDSATPFLGADGVVDPRYVVPEAGGAEHHLDDRVTDNEIRRLIWQCIDAARPA